MAEPSLEFLLEELNFFMADNSCISRTNQGSCPPRSGPLHGMVCSPASSYKSNTTSKIAKLVHQVQIQLKQAFLLQVKARATCYCYYNQTSKNSAKQELASKQSAKFRKRKNLPVEKKSCSAYMSTRSISEF